METQKLQERIQNYLNFINSSEYDEQYKFEFFQNNQINFLDYIDNFEEKFKEIRKKAFNLIPKKFLGNLLIILWTEAKDDFVRIFKYLYNEEKNISDRINYFEKELYDSMKKTSLKNLDFAKLGFWDVSFLLSLYNYKKYLFINPVRPFNNFIKEFNLEKEKYNNKNPWIRYKNWLELAKNEILPELQKYIENANLLDVQDFLFCNFWLSYLEEVKSLEDLKENLNNFYNIWLNGKEEDKKYLRKLLRGWKNFVAFQKEWKIYFIPSRYIWYKEANINRHKIEQWGWWETNKAISKILWELKENEQLWKMYQDFLHDKNLGYWRFWQFNLDNNTYQLWIENTLNNQKPKMKNIDKITKLLNAKKQIILYWPPWTWKTFNVENLIKEHSGEDDYEKMKQDGKVEFITFHQSFSYEEFIEWIKAETDESWNVFYEIKDGIFKEICENSKLNKRTNFDESYNKLLEDLINIDWWILKLKTKNWNEFWISVNSRWSLNLHTWKDFKKQGSLTKENLKKQAESNEKIFDYWESYFYSVIKYLKEKYNYSTISQLTKTKNYYLIIDEINRWNISKIFGELITLLEADKRNDNWKVKLPYSKKDFWVPENLYIIATMNTSDKSIVSLDTALRRRFWFVEMLPDYDLLKEKEIDWINLGKLLEKINLRIEYLLDKDHIIGHSYFLKVENLEDLKQVFYNEIIPLLEEYFYGEEDKIKEVDFSKKKKNLIKIYLMMKVFLKKILIKFKI